MIAIHKTSAGPSSLQAYAAKGYRFDEHVSFTGIKQEIRNALCTEQGFLCCYCMSRISPGSESMQIAHIQNQKAWPELDCQYSNMMGSCASKDSCNQRQKNHDLKYSPTDHAHPIQHWINYSKEGVISSEDRDFDQDLNRWLNLNSNRLFFPQNRAAIYKSVVMALQKVSSFEEKKQKARSLLHFWKSKKNGEFREYYGVAIWLLEKKLSQWEMTNA